MALSPTIVKLYYDQLGYIINISYQQHSFRNILFYHDG